MSDSELRRRYREVFDGVAEEYDRERPTYPNELIEAAITRGGLSAGDPVVEVGCGTGLLTASLVAQGLAVDAIDPGENMIRLAERRVGEGGSTPISGSGSSMRTGLSPSAPAASCGRASSRCWSLPACAEGRAALMRRAAMLGRSTRGRRRRAGSS